MPQPLFARITSVEEEKRNSARKQFDLELSVKPPVMLIIAKSDKSPHGSVTLLLENALTAKSPESGHCKNSSFTRGLGTTSSKITLLWTKNSNNKILQSLNWSFPPPPHQNKFLLIEKEKLLKKKQGSILQQKTPWTRSPEMLSSLFSDGIWNSNAKP